MTLKMMKDDLHRALWGAYERWTALKAQGETKHELKVRGLREHGDMTALTRNLLFTGVSRVAYERELKRFLEFCYYTRGRSDNREIDKRDFRAYLEFRLTQGDSANELEKVKSAIVKLGSVYGRYASFHAMSKWFGARIRAKKRTGEFAPPARPRMTPQVREAVLRELERLDAAWEERSGQPRAYALALRLQEEASLRAIEATERFTGERLLGLNGPKGRVSILGKGGRVREVEVSADLYARLEAYFRRRPDGPLADLRGYELAFRRAALAVGGRTTATHANRRDSATEKKNEAYQEYRELGLAPGEARERAVQDAVEHLGHSRYRTDLARTYLH